MWTEILAFGFIALLISGVVIARRIHLRDRALAKLRRMEATQRIEAVERNAVTVFPKRYPWLAPVTGALLLIALVLLAIMPRPIAAAFSCLGAVLVWVLEWMVADRKLTRIESQLAEAIDLMTGSLRAGAAFLSSLEAAHRETREPLRTHLSELAGRIRLGDDPRAAMFDLSEKIPISSFRLFSLSLSVHLETGGSLATTLSAIGRTVRDRLDLARRVQAQAVEVQASVIALLAISYGTTGLMFRANPKELAAFLTSEAGSYIAAAAILLQAVGIFWIVRMSKAGQ